MLGSGKLIYGGISKGEGVWLGATDKSVQNCSGIQFVNEPIKCLGIYIGGSTKERWKERKLTMFGKVAIIKSLAVSQLVFNFSLVSVSCDVIKRINKSVYNFLWNSKDRIRRNV